MKPILFRTCPLLFRVPIVVALLLIGTVTTGCQNYRRFKKTIKGQRNLVYQINTTGNTSQVAYISTRNLVEALGNEADQYTTIDRFRLTSMKIGITPTAGNTATGFQLVSLAATSAYNSALNPWQLVDLKNYPTSFPLNASGAFLVNNILSGAGVQMLNDVVEKELVGRSLGGIVDKFIGVELKGTNIPINSRAMVTLTISLEVMMDYSTCQKVPEVLFLDTPKCE